MSTLVSVSLFLLFGLIVGAIARMAMPGHERGGWVLSMLLGMAGAFVGGLIARAVGIYGVSEPAGFALSILGAMTLVGAYQAVRAWPHSHA